MACSALVGCGGDDGTSPGASAVAAATDGGPLGLPCAPEPAPPEPGFAADRPFQPGECRENTDCTRGAAGACVLFDLFAACTYHECEDTSDCGMGGPCHCATREEPLFRNTCAPGSCAGDADCPEGEACLPSSAGCGLNVTPGYHCSTPDDECDAGTPGCRHDASLGRWVIYAQPDLCGTEERTLFFSVEGLDAREGKPVVVPTGVLSVVFADSTSLGGPEAPITVEQGGFAFNAARGPVWFYVDVDGDGQCDSDVDLVYPGLSPGDVSHWRTRRAALLDASDLTGPCLPP